MNPDIWKHIATLINLLTFFFSFSAFSVGLYIAGRVKRELKKGMLTGVVDAFIIAAAGLTVRTFMAIMAELHWLDETLAKAIGDLALLAMAAGLFLAYLTIERYFKRLESKKLER